MINQKSEDAHHAAPDQAIERTDAQLFGKQLARVFTGDLPQGERAHDHGDGLIAGVAADTCDDRH